MFKTLKKLLGGRRSQRREEAARRDFVYSLVNEKSQPNFDALMLAVRDLDIAKMNIKAFGYELARRLEAELPVPAGTTARHVGLLSKPSTQIDMESDWVAHWSGQLGTPVIYHRKLWEVAYVLQAIYEQGHLRQGARGLGFGCGTEVTPSYLAAHGATVTVTDLPPDSAHAAGWAETRQHAANLDQTFHPHLVDRTTFDALVHLRYVDMTAIPDDLAGYDFCWSMCALEHIGTIQLGLDFIENSLKTLRPGGLAVHTTEFNVNPDGPTLDNWPTVLFQRHHMEGLAARLREQGHDVAELDFDFGDKPMDRFVDLPPWGHPPAVHSFSLGSPHHLKVSVDGFPCTCFGMVIRKKG